MRKKTQALCLYFYTILGRLYRILNFRSKKVRIVSDFRIKLHCIRNRSHKNHTAHPLWGVIKY